MKRAQPYSPKQPLVESEATDPPKNNDCTIPDFSAALVSARELLEMQLPKRPALLGAWMKEGDLGYLFAPRGAGKSWMAMLIGNAISQGVSLGEWTEAAAVRPVVYFDAEMNLPDVQERAKKIGINSEGFQWLSNERLFSGQGAGLNIANRSHQTALSKLLPDGCLFIVDNLSTAQLGMEENSNDSFDVLRDWFLSLRHRRITIMIVHHAGRNGSMRGGSRREDMAHWIMALKSANEEGKQGYGFTTNFVKCRNCKANEAPALKWGMIDQGGRIDLECTAHSGPDAMLGHIRDGVGSASELAELLGVQKGTISKWAKKLQTEKLIETKNREYHALD